MKCPEWEFVGGEGIEAMAYDEERRLLYLKFWENEKPYEYSKVEPESYQELYVQEHKTTFFNKNMRHYKYKILPRGYFDCKKGK